MASPILLLEDEDLIEASDYVRQLDLLYTGQSDYLATRSTYGGSPINHLKWIEVSRSCPAWVGKTVGEFRNVMLDTWRPHQEVPDYEFIRGTLPADHILPETRYEEYLRVHKYFALGVGKYKGKPAIHVKAMDPGYYTWAVDAGLIPYATWQSLNEFA